MLRSIRARRIRTPVAVLAVAGSVALTTVTGEHAWTAISPQDLAFITAPEIPVVPAEGLWERSVTIRDTGEVAGRPGNRHTVTVAVQRGTTTHLPGQIRIQDDECDAAGTCRPVAAAEGDLGYNIPPPPLGADGSVHLDFTVPGSRLRSTLPGGPAEFPDAVVDLIVTPVGRASRPR